MKQARIKKRYPLILICMILWSYTIGYGDDAKANSLSGHLFTGVVYCTGDLSLNDASEDDHKRIESLSESSDNLSEVAGFVTGQLNYTFGPYGTTIGIGNADGPIMVHLEQPVGDMGSLLLGVYADEQDVWADPYTVGSDRIKTDQETVGVRVGLHQVFESDISLLYDISWVDTDKDLSGQRDTRLKRDGSIHSLAMETGLFASGKHQFNTGITGTIADLSGDSYAYNGLSGELSHTYQEDLWDIRTAIRIGGRFYDEPHPEFNSEREDRTASFETALTVYDPLGLENYFVTTFGSVTAVDSNIGFFSSTQLCLGLGVGYAF